MASALCMSTNVYTCAAIYISPYIIYMHVHITCIPVQIYTLLHIKWMHLYQLQANVADTQCTQKNEEKDSKQQQQTDAEKRQKNTRAKNKSNRQREFAVQSWPSCVLRTKGDIDLKPIASTDPTISIIVSKTITACNGFPIWRQGEGGRWQGGSTLWKWKPLSFSLSLPLTLFALVHFSAALHICKQWLKNEADLNSLMCKFTKERDRQLCYYRLQLHFLPSRRSVVKGKVTDVEGKREKNNGWNPNHR